MRYVISLEYSKRKSTVLSQILSTICNAVIKKNVVQRSVHNAELFLIMVAMVAIFF